MSRGDGWRRWRHRRQRPAKGDQERRKKPNSIPRLGSGEAEAADCGGAAKKIGKAMKSDSRWWEHLGVRVRFLRRMGATEEACECCLEFKGRRRELMRRRR